MKWLFRAFLVLMLLALGLVGAGYHYGQTLLLPADPSNSKKVLFEIKGGMLGNEVARDLARQGLIKDELAFRLLLRFHPQGKDIRVGFFELSPNETALEIFHDLQHAKDLTRHATFPEGLVIPQVASVAKKASLIQDEAKFREMASRGGKSFGAIFPESLEGYLLPDTYEFPYKCDEKVVLKRFTDEFRGRVVPLWERRKAKSPLKTLREVVILASLIEREAQVPQERPIIAGVYVNRLKVGMMLQCDATIQYALGKQKAVLLYSDLELDSPYNSYKHYGLPPGPIANPGMSSLEAAMAPTPSKYFYYVRDDVKNDGSHRFARTDAEHNANIARYQR
ncbi:MAG: endolytic transglycosylase MltG [Candidatus Eremiobacteraeota bacterium]|nr:endolytic transglycosylase MltG [Candidatus Eremiobacteraeota bacterium]